MSGYTNEYRAQNKIYKEEIIELHKKLPRNYTELILKHKLSAITDPAQKKAVRKTLTRIINGESYAMYTNNPDLVAHINELADKYQFFLQIFGNEK